jgi:hypothetical protein
MATTARLRNGPAAGCGTTAALDVVWVATDLRADGRPVPHLDEDGTVTVVPGTRCRPVDGRDRRWEFYRRPCRATAAWDACWRPELDLPGSEEAAYVWVPSLRVTSPP